MLSACKDIVKVKPNKKNETLRPLTVVFWSDFMMNPSVMYGLFAPTPRKLNYDPDKVKVMGTRDGMINQINVERVEDLDSICEELLGMPLLIRVWAEHVNQQPMAASSDDHKWEGDLALLVDTSHPMIRPPLEKSLERARRLLQSGKKFCVMLDFGPAITAWLRVSYPRPTCTLGSVRNHKARLYITNYAKPEHCFDCSPLWYIFFSPCWLLTAPFYRLYRCCRCKDIRIIPLTNILRRHILASGKVVEISRFNTQTVVDDLSENPG